MSFPPPNNSGPCPPPPAGDASAGGAQPRTLYVGNLEPNVTEDLMCALFTQIGHINGCKIIHEPGSDPYCFVEFTNHTDASTALTTMNQRICLGRPLRVNWASSALQQQTAAPRQDTSKHHHIFVGDLSPQVETTDLQEAFAPFGEISDCRVVKDQTSQKSKGYGFVSFTNKLEAEHAIQMMNGSWIGSRPIRTNWATRKPPPASHKEEPAFGTSSFPGGGSGGPRPPQGYDEVFNQSSATNSTVYCGSLSQMAASPECLRQAFEEFGEILDVRVFKEKGYAFLRFSRKEAACQAIVSRHNTELGGQIIKCSWGKEQEPLQMAVQQHNIHQHLHHAVHQRQRPQPHASYHYDPYQMNYWYSAGGFNHMEAAAAAAAAAAGGFVPAGGDYMAAQAIYAAASPYAGQYYTTPYGPAAMTTAVPGGPVGPALAFPPQQYPSQ